MERGEVSQPTGRWGLALPAKSDCHCAVCNIEEINKARSQAAPDAAWITNIFGRIERLLFVAKYFWQIFIPKDFC